MATRCLSFGVLAICSSFFAFTVGAAHGCGLLGCVLEDVGKATGIEPLEDLGDGLDEAHRTFKDNVPIYKKVEEESSGFVRKQFQTACSLPYQTITNYVIVQCSNWDGRLEGQNRINEAVNLLTRAGLAKANEFSSLSIRWCPLNGADGMAPDRNKIYLDRDYINSSTESIAALLAHELTHTRQYRRMGTDSFKCNYSQAYTKCGGCQNRSNDLEREAYEFQDKAQDVLAKTGWQMCNNSSSDNVFVSYAVKEQNQWITRGWRKIKKGDCSLLTESAPSRFVYYYAIADDSIVWQDSSRGVSLCTNPTEKFEHINGSTCSTEWKTEKFVELDTNDKLWYSLSLVDPSGWKICNKSSDEVVYLAYSYKDGTGWVKEGWRNIKKNTCAVLLSTKNVKSDFVYYYAESNSGRWVGKKPLCIDPKNKFESRTTHCSETESLVNFTEKKFGRNRKLYTNLVD